MFTDTLDGAAKQHFGRLEEAVGDVIGDRQLQAKGVLDDAAGAVEQVDGLASDTAHEALSQAARRARNARGDLEDLVAGRPILATGITLGDRDRPRRVSDWRRKGRLPPTRGAR